MIEKYHWQAPKRNNNRAWKRIEKGEWLWDRRRLRRGIANHYTDEAWLPKPNYDGKGQRKFYRRFQSRKNQPDPDMGG